MAIDKENKPRISVNIIAYNEEEEIADCIKSARLLADEIVFVDNESIDNTKKIAAKLVDKTYSFPNSGYVEPARNFGIEKCSGDWVFILDADERITPALAKALKEKVLSVNDTVSAFSLPRKNFNFGYWLKRGGWWPDYQTRFIRKSHFINWPKEIHSFPEIKGKIEKLAIPFEHYAIKNIAEMLERTIRYSEKEVKLLVAAGRPVNSFILVRKMLGEFYRRGIKERGLWDGMAGFIQVIYQTFSVFITYAQVWERQFKNDK